MVLARREVPKDAELLRLTVLALVGRRVIGRNLMVTAGMARIRVVGVVAQLFATPAFVLRKWLGLGFPMTQIASVEEL